MKIFTSKTGSYDDKINFIDENSVLVGYNMAADCCEQFGWFIAKEKLITIDETHPFIVENKSIPTYDFSSYRFDTSFQEHIIMDENIFECGGIKRFKLVSINENEPILYLHLYNAQNGYYSHGFEIKHGDKIIETNYI